jgi:C1A family cysteine protease
MNNKILLLGAIALTGVFVLLATQNQAAPSGDSLTLDAFKNFRTTYNKNYLSANELEYRLEVFRQNFEMIEKHNADSTSTYTLGVNQFTDMTYEELKAKYLGVEENFQIPEEHQNFGEFINFNDDNEVDWTAKGVVHAVKNQARCGSCWAFSANGALESALAIFKGQKDLDIAEQELVDCSRKYGNQGCNGGLMHYAYAYVRDKGINNSADYPYRAVDQACKSVSGQGPHHLKSFTQVQPGVDNIVAAARKQPVAVAFYVQNDFFSYKSGVYNPASCPGRPNHAVLVTGFKLDGDLPYFTIKNSWGTSWGDKGYFKIAKRTGAGTCNLAGHSWNYVPNV